MLPVFGTLVVPGVAMVLIAGPLATLLVLGLTVLVMVLVSAMGEQFRRAAAREWELRRARAVRRGMGRRRALA